MADQEKHLEQSTVPDVDFQGVKLSINTENENEGRDGSVELPPSQQTVAERHPPGYLLGDKNTRPLPPVIQEGFFAGKNGRLEEAVAQCQSQVLDPNADGTVQGVWLLTEVDHWDNERERVILLTQKTILNIRYDFVSCKVKDAKRVLFKDIDSVQRGLFEYPEKTLVVPRNGIGLRIHWGKGRDVGFFEWWNPLAGSIPYMTLTSHPLEHSTQDTSNYKVDSFETSLVQAVNVFRQEQNASSPSLPVTESPIRTDIMLGWHSAVFNQSRLGYSRERGGISF